MLLAVILRYSLRDFISGDFRNFTRPWYKFIAEKGGLPALAHDFTNYTPLYPTLMTGVYYLLPGVSTVIAVKLIAVIFDFVAAIFAFRLVRLKYIGGIAPYFAFMAILFSPTVVLNSSFWGQSDVIYTAGLLACVYFLAIDRETLGFLAFGFAFAFKLQSLFLAPFLFILWLTGKVSWKRFLLIPIVYLVTVIPSWLTGRPLSELLSVYLTQAGFYRDLTKNAPNLYQWFSNKQYDILYPAGMIWTAALMVLFSWGVYKSRTKITTDRMIQLATISALVMPYFLPKMHDRYFFAVDVLSIVFAFYFPRYFFVPILIGLVSLLSYVPFLFHFRVIPFSQLALVLLVVIVVLMRHLIMTLTAAPAISIVNSEVAALSEHNPSPD
ncbi:MAG: hypothetical protein ACE5E7_05975 [Anaerolineae bacterium]